MPAHDVVRRLARLSLVVATLACVSTVGAQGRIRDLTCRGKAGIALKVDLDPSPRDTARVVMSLDYTRSTAVIGDSLKQLAPGTCTWNSYGFEGYPVEPGRVRFDVWRQAQRWSDTATRMMDTTVGAARFYPDPVTLPRYLNDPRHYWKFYVDDATNLAVSYISLFDDGLPTFVTIKGPVTLADDVRRDLVCRGGTTGLTFAGGTNAGDNLARVVLGYRVSATVPGPAGLGLAAGTCAWTNRTAMPKEPGKIAFLTARNAQIKQAQSGSIDRTATAAERYPDVNSIPEYLKDSRHYWTFSVISRDPDSALTNGPWMRDLASAVTGTRTTATSTTRSGANSPGSQVYQPGAGAPTASLPTSSVGSQVYQPGAGAPTVSLPTSSTVGGTYQPGGAGSTSVVKTIYDIKNVTVTPALEGVTIRFEAAANSNPTVSITPASVGATLNLKVASYPGSAGMMRYVATNEAALPRNMSYNFGILASATGNARQNNTSGTFKTLSQRVTIHISEINLINDGDSDSDGEVNFGFNTCTLSIDNAYVAGRDGAPMSWGDGPQWLDLDLKSVAEVPDRFRMVVEGIEDDHEIYNRSGFRPKVTCAKPNRPPGRSSTEEWNSLFMDFDLTKYKGPKNGDVFVRRSQPPSGGAQLEFEIRGSWEVTRQ
jgi:hypothetical protein